MTIPPDCYVVAPGSDPVAFELTEQVDSIAARAAALARGFIRKKIARKARDLKRYHCRPAYLLISASLFPRSVRSARSFAVLKTPESVVDHSFDIGAFTAVFLHDPDGRSYRIGQDGPAVEMERRSIATPCSANETRARSRPSDTLDRQLAYFRRHQRELAEEHHGKVEAYAAAVKDGNLGSVLIRKCLRLEEERPQEFHSRIRVSP